MLRQMVVPAVESSVPFPRMLLGTAMIFWGWMVDLPMVGLVLAFLLEGPHWVSIRWNFTEVAHVRAWSISVIAMLITAFFLWMGGIQPETVRRFISWMPLFLVSLQFTQSYGFQQKIPLNTFSYFSRKKLAIDRAMGLNPQPQMIAFTPIFFVLSLVFSAAGANAHKIFFFPGIVLLSAWCLWKAGPEQNRRRSALVAALIAMTAVASVGQWGMRYAHEMLMGGNEGNYGGRNPSQWNRSNTQIGQVGQIKQSAEIFWRLRQEQGAMPRLLGTASYNRYFASGHWRYETPENTTQENDFRGMNVPGRADQEQKSSENEKLFYTTGEMGIDQNQRADLPRFSMRGMVKPDSLLPLPGSLHTLHTAVQSSEHNSVGTIRITPLHAVLDATVRWDGEIDRDGPPFLSENTERPEDTIDLDVPAQERAVLREIVDALGMKTMTLEQKISTLEQYFRNNFTYSTWLTINGDLSKKRVKEEKGNRFRTMTGRDSALAQFLLEEKRGHCEYFATATTLLLRMSGEKCRYCVGFSVQERNAKTGEMILRGTHGHAWCRVWNQRTQRWQDVDTTPPSWVSMDAAFPTWMQDTLDWLQRLREDFTVWRTQPENQTLTLTVFSIIAVGVFSWIGFKLWTTRSRMAREKKRTYQPSDIKTPLSELERWLTKKLGQRPAGMPFARWLEPLKKHTEPALIDDAIRAHNQLRYDPAAPSEDLRDQLAALCQRLRSELR